MTGPKGLIEKIGANGEKKWRRMEEMNRPNQGKV